MAGGLRGGADQGEVDRRAAPTAGGPDAPNAPGGRDLGGPDPRRRRARADLERLARGARAIRSIGSTGSTRAGGAVTPGLIDPHTHLLFAGSREGELELRQQGAGYLEILAAGGGILSTVAATRAATRRRARAHGRRWLDEMLGHGSTTIEAKSGYGLDLATELRLLEVAHRLGREGPIEVVPTWLGAHAVPPEFRDRPDGDRGLRPQRHRRAAAGGRGPGPARLLRRVLRGGRRSRPTSRGGSSRRRRASGCGRGCTPTSSAPRGGAELAAEIGATCRPTISRRRPRPGIDALAAAAAEGRPVVATLLPATTWFLMKDHHAPARTFIERGVPVAIGTDFNPGTSPTPSLPLAMTVACLNLRMTPGRGPGGGDDQRRPRRSGWATRSARSRTASRPIS